MTTLTINATYNISNSVDCAYVLNVSGKKYEEITLKNGDIHLSSTRANIYFKLLKNKINILVWYASYPHLSSVRSYTKPKHIKDDDDVSFRDIYRLINSKDTIKTYNCDNNNLKINIMCAFDDDCDDSELLEFLEKITDDYKTLYDKFYDSDSDSDSDSDDD
jgi:hypothetical protein